MKNFCIILFFFFHSQALKLISRLSTSLVIPNISRCNYILGTFSVTKLNALILGVNKYSHDTSICILDADSGNILFTQAKERISSRKHDGGSVTNLLQYGLESIGGFSIYCVTAH